MTDIKLGKLLLVDDEHDIIGILSRILEKHVAEIHTASNGKEALDKLKSINFDAVLSDINMPVMNGLDLLANIRHMGSEIPFIVLTGFADTANTREALRLGATDFIDKPFDVENMVTSVKKAIQLGVALHEIESLMETMYTQESLPADKKIQLRKIKQSILMMKVEMNMLKK